MNNFVFDMPIYAFASKAESVVKKHLNSKNRTCHNKVIDW